VGEGGGGGGGEGGGGGGVTCRAVFVLTFARFILGSLGGIEEYTMPRLLQKIQRMFSGRTSSTLHEFNVLCKFRKF